MLSLPFFSYRWSPRPELEVKNPSIEALCEYRNINIILYIYCVCIDKKQYDNRNAQKNAEIFVKLEFPENI